MHLHVYAISHLLYNAITNDVVCRFSPQQMVEGLAERDIKLTAVIDLTFTKRYYNASVSYSVVHDHRDNSDMNECM